MTKARTTETGYEISKTVHVKTRLIIYIIIYRTYYFLLKKKRIKFEKCAPIITKIVISVPSRYCDPFEYGFWTNRPIIKGPIEPLTLPSPQLHRHALR